MASLSLLDGQELSFTLLLLSTFLKLLGAALVNVFLEINPASANIRTASGIANRCLTKECRRVDYVHSEVLGNTDRSLLQSDLLLLDHLFWLLRREVLYGATFILWLRSNMIWYRQQSRGDTGLRVFFELIGVRLTDDLVRRPLRLSLNVRGDGETKAI